MTYGSLLQSPTQNSADIYSTKNPIFYKFYKRPLTPKSHISYDKTDAKYVHSCMTFLQWCPLPNWIHPSVIERCMEPSVYGINLWIDLPWTIEQLYHCPIWITKIDDEEKENDHSYYINLVRFCILVFPRSENNFASEQLQVQIQGTSRGGGGYLEA